MSQRQLIVCCDGTSNNVTGGRSDTNVVKFLRWLGNEDSDQLVFYDPGVGNAGNLPAATVWDGFKREWERLAGLAFGRGVYENIAEGYRFLMANYRPGDQIFVFGFSRGAFTARSIGGLVIQFGILRPDMVTMVPTLINHYFSKRKGISTQEFDRITSHITRDFCAEDCRRVPVYFTGVWDTVASVGMWPFEAKITAKPTIAEKNFVHVRQALALDEHRKPFKPRPYVDANGSVGPGQTMRQLWFRGSHCDVGGGYEPVRCAISDEALAWMIDEAHKCGLRLDIRNVPQPDYQCILKAIRDPRLIGQPPIVHSETYYNCLWAIPGLTIRTPSVVEMDDGKDISVPAEAHPSVQTDLKFPANSVWARSRPKEAFVPGVVAAVLLYFLMGLLLMKPLGDGESAWSLFPAAFSAIYGFISWQLLWWTDGSLMAFDQFRWPRWTLAADFAFLLTYAYLLAWFAVRGFAYLVRFTGLGSRPGIGIRVLGTALTIAVIADVVENVITWSLISLAPYVGPIEMHALGYAMSAAFAVKLLAVAGVTVLALRSFVPTGEAKVASRVTALDGDESTRTP